MRGLSRHAGNRVVCYCDSCQAFATKLGQSDAVLDAHGGTDIFQLSPARITLTRGREGLARLQLSPKGPLRWYASCCDWPIANTPGTGRIPFAGLIVACLNTGERSVDDVLGPVRMRIMTQYATDGPVHASNTHAGFPPSIFAWVALHMLGWRLRGDHRRSPFFDRETGKPIAAPGHTEDRGRSDAG